MTTDGKGPVIEDWRIIEVDGTDRHLVGRIYDHPILHDGARAITSRLLWIDEAAAAARTQSRLYHLGRKGTGPLSDDWARWLDFMLAIAWRAKRTG